jgi:RNA polymerase sigma factor (sigma-70 family)
MITRGLRPGARYPAGDGAARLGREDLGALYETQRRPLFRLAFWLVGEGGTAEEIVHDAFVGLLWRLDRSGPPADPPAYLRTSVVNGARSFRRRQAARRAARGPLHVDIPSGPDQASDAVADIVRVRQALMQLPLRQRECVVLRYYADLTDAEVAETLGVALGTVKAHLHRAREALSRRLDCDD